MRRKNEDNPLIITSLKGGLGNQMFQYAAGRVLALRLDAELKLDLSWFNSMSGDTPRSFMLDAFPCVRAAAATRQECEQLMYFPRGLFERLFSRPRRHAAGYIAEPHFPYWDGFEHITAPAYLFGYWQSELYFSACADTLRQEFAFPPLPPGEVEKMADRIRATCNAVAVHVRRGDYVANQNTQYIHGLCSQAYYTQAMNIIIKNIDEAKFFLFTDDLAWVRENFTTQGFSAAIVDFPEHTKEPWHDMHLMALCAHHIIANSSFSWWGAWLANKGGMVCAPQRWFAAPEKQNDSPVLARWIQL